MSRGKRRATRAPEPSTAARRAAPAWIRRGPSLAATLAILAVFLALQHAGAIGAPFFSDDYIFIDKLRTAPFAAVFAARDLAYHWYRPWSRELHYWVFYRFFHLDPVPYHVASFALWLAAMGLYFVLIIRIASRSVAAIATAGVAALALWIVPIEWAAGVQDLWMLVFALLALNAHAGRRPGWTAAALFFALFSKETAAVVPAIAFAYSMAIDRVRWREALRRVTPLVLVIAGWLAIHPALGGRYWLPGTFPPLPSVHTDPLTAFTSSIRALFNLDLWPRPPQGFGVALLIAAPGAVALGFLALRGVLAIGSDEGEVVEESKADEARRAALASSPGSSAAAAASRARPASTLVAAGTPSERAVILFGIAWMVLAWLPLLVPSVLWQSYYAGFGALGAWLAIAMVLARSRMLAVAVVLALALLRGPRAETPSRDWGNVVLQRFGKTFMGVTESYLRRRLPMLPPHARLFFTTVPRGVVFITNPYEAPALRVWYRDSTVVGSFWADYRPRGARDPAGPDYFFRYDSLAGWIEVRPGPENFRAAWAANPEWRQDHEKLARTFVDARDFRSAATEFEKLAAAHPEDPNYSYLLGLSFEQLGVRDSSALWIRRAAALPGADEGIKAKARGLGAAR
jgi:hypothetical protein